MPVLRQPFRAMASHCEVVLAVDDAAAAYGPVEQAVAEVRRIEARFSRYRPDSIVSRINAAAGGPALACDAETCALLDYADALYRASDGLFDITAGVLRRVWDFGVPRLPAPAALAQCRALIGWQRVEREGSHIRLPQAGMELDFGGFGKEYAVDRAADMLARAGMRHGYVNLGGDLRVIGPRPDGQPWQIGIRDPRQPGALIASMPMVRGGLATSGDYERYFELDGQRYCHVLDPGSGQPVTFWRTVSVVAPLAVLAGNYSTIAMLRQAGGLDFLKAAGVSYLAVDHTGRLYVSGAA